MTDKQAEVTERWVMTIFGSWAAYNKSLPARYWFESLEGWSSQSR